MDADWPPVQTETRPWRQRVRRGTRDDRMMSSVEATIPPLIADLDYPLTGAQVRDSEIALGRAAAMDADARSSSGAITRFMIRTESVASSRIERVSATSEDFARALVGSKANDAARSMVAASLAVTRMIEAAGTRQRIDQEDLLEAHAILMADDPAEGLFAGRWRGDQNWIGGSDVSPRGALHVPPDAQRIPSLTADLVDFGNRDDIPVLAQVAIAHAQFETIHPFGDGNGRIGRALIGAILRRRQVVQHSIIPIASGFSADREEYFDALTAYRHGNVAPILGLTTRSMEAAGYEGRITVERIRELPIDWAERVAVRSDAAARTLLAALLQNPVMSAADAEAAAATSSSQVYGAIRQLEDAEIIHEITGRQRNRVWVATEVMDELDDLDRRILLRMRMGGS